MNNILEPKDYKFIKFDYSGENSAAPELVSSYHELDKEGWSIRVVAEYRNGQYGYSTEKEEMGTSFPQTSIYPLEELDLQNNPLFEITKEEFEAKWNFANDYVKQNGSPKI